MENWQIRKFFKMTEDQTGILVNWISPASNAFGVIQRDDVILRIDGTPLANDSTIEFRKTGERITFEYLLTQKFVGDSCELEILRNGKVMNVTVKTIERQSLVPPVFYDKKPSYFVFAGLVFERFVQPYLHENGDGKDFSTS
jgi:S1-C subfamily serine protease